MWEKLSTKLLLKHPRLTVMEDHVLLPGGHEIDYLRFEPYGDIPTIIARRDDGRVLMTKEHAYPINKALLQFPEGHSEQGEDILTAGARELAEEAQVKAHKLTILGPVLMMHRRSTTNHQIILAEELEASEKLEGDLEEAGTTVHWFSEAEIWKKIAQGEIIQKNALAAWAVYQAHHQR